jgi:hypothetical protein
VIGLATTSAQNTSLWDQPGTLAFLIVFGMGVIVYFLLRSMSRHLRKVREAAAVEAAMTVAANPAANRAARAAVPGDGVTAFPAGNGPPPGN